MARTSSIFMQSLKEMSMKFGKTKGTAGLFKLTQLLS